MSEAMTPPNDTSRLRTRQKAKRTKQALKNVKPYTVRSVPYILDVKLPPLTEIWGGICLANEVYEIVGASGIGKSRILLNLALRQCLAFQLPECDAEGKPLVPEFAGHPLSRARVKWLFLGTENSIYRYKEDLTRMVRGLNLTSEQIDAISENLLLPTLESAEDFEMSIDPSEEGLPAESNFTRLLATIEQCKPDIVVFDPWGDLIGASELDDAKVRQTIHRLYQLRGGREKPLAFVIVNHARGGMEANLGAVNLDAAQFGKNSKVLYTVSRAVWNLMALDDAIGCKLIGVINAKRSNGKTYAAHAVRLNDETLCYDYEPAVNVENCVRTLQFESKQPVQNQADVRAQATSNKFDKAMNAVLAKLADGKMYARAYLKGVAKKSGADERSVVDIFATLVEENGVEMVVNPYEKNTSYYGMSQAAAAYREALAKMKDDAEEVPKKKRGRPRKSDQ